MWLFHPADVVHVRELAAMRRNTSQHKNKLVSLSVDALQQRCAVGAACWGMVGVGSWRPPILQP